MFIGRPPYIEQLNDISFWYPILERIGMRTPKTQLFYIDREAGKIVDGEQTDSFKHLVAEVGQAMEEFGGKAFLRTGQTSNKHDWKDTCFIDRKSNLVNHIYRLIEFSMMADLPYTTFAVREVIDTKPIVTTFNDMPIAREIRLFAESGKIVCSHPYWPSEAFTGKNKITEQQLLLLQQMPDMEELTLMAEFVSSAFQGAWSIDFLQDTSGNWWLIDMAQAGSSYHWKGCEHQHDFEDI